MGFPGSRSELVAQDVRLGLLGQTRPFNMFKKTKHPDFIVGHRLKGANTKRDPLLDEKMGSNKRSRVEDGSASVIYKETPDERKARLLAERQAEKELKEAQRGRKGPGLGPSKASILGLPDPEEHAAEEGIAEEAPATRVPLSRKEAQSNLASFRERLQGSKLPEQAAAAETKHRAELEAETAKALAANGKKTAASSKSAAPDADERLTMNDIWKAGEGDGFGIVA